MSSTPPFLSAPEEKIPPEPGVPAPLSCQVCYPPSRISRMRFPWQASISVIQWPRFFGQTFHFKPRVEGVPDTDRARAEWPWWRRVRVRVVRLAVSFPSTGYRLWVYTRHGAYEAEVCFDRRPRVEPPWER